jgi:hypothetical protein
VKKLALMAGLAMLVLPACGDDTSGSGGNEGTTSSTAATTSTTSPTTSATASTSTSGSSSAKIAVPNVVGKNLQLAQDTMQAAGLYNLKSHDSTGQGRLQVLDRNWEVTDQSPPAGTMVTADQLIDLGAKKNTD